MNNIRKVFLITLLLIIAAAAAHAECAYLTQYGDHDWVYGRTDATCQQAGEVYRDCSVCKLHEVQQTLPVTDHSWSNEVPTKNPTCTEPGENSASCLVCGKLRITAVPALGHKWSDYQVTKEPACNVSGEKKRSCSICGASETESIAALEHDWGKVEQTVAPSCTSEGEQLIACSICGALRTEAIGMIDHDYGEWTIVREASCTSTGLRGAVCSMCRKSINEAIERSAHEYGEWIVTLEPTGSTMGRRYRQCEACGATNEEDFYPEGTLYRGMHKNDDVLELQQMLFEIGFLKDEPDGLFGKNTEQAVKDAQEFAEIEVSGVAYPETLDAIRNLWQMLNEINVTLESGNGSEICSYSIDSSGMISISLCEKHLSILLECSALYGDDIGVEEYMELSEQEYTAWLNAYNDVIAGISIHSSDAADAIQGYLEAEISLIENTYGANAALIQKKKIEAVRGICIELCEILQEMN